MLYIYMPASTGLLVNNCSYTSLRPTSGMFIVHDLHQVIGLSGHTLEQRNRLPALRCRLHLMDVSLLHSKRGC